MNNEYIIINKTAIQKRIEWLEQRELNKWQQDELRNLRLLLSQSTTLIPEIEKAFDAGEKYGTQVSIKGNKQDYISQLKLDI